MNTFANRFKTLRTELGLTQPELASKFGKTKSCISSYEQRGRFPDESLLKEYASFFQVSCDYLLGVSDIRNPISPETKSFAQELIDSMIKKGMIDENNDVDDKVTGMIIQAIRLDIENNKKKD